MLTRFLRGLPLILLLFFAAWSVIYWLRLNDVPYGRDAGGHLATSLAYLPLLEQPTPASLFRVLLVNGYRPPLLYLSSLPFYAIFGIDFDSALYANVFWLLLAVTGCYMLGRRLAGHWAGVLGALLYLLFPFVHGVARLFYFETALVAFVAWNLVALLYCEGWTRRGWSVIWGITLGLGMLTKWTLPATVGLPSLYVLWHAWRSERPLTRLGIRAPAVPVGRLRSALPQTSFPFLAFVAGVVLALLFLYPNRDAIPATVLGNWLYPLFALTWGSTLLFLLSKTGRWGNLAAGLLVTLSIMSVWYYLQPGFVLDFVDAAYLTAEGRDEPLDLSQPRTYIYYLSYFFTELAGPLLALLILPLLLVPLIAAVRWREWRPDWSPEAAVVLWLALSGTYLAFTFASYNSERSMLALLVPVALLAGACLAPSRRSVRDRRALLARGVVLLLLIAVGLTQWALMTLPSMAPAWARSSPLLARGEFIQHPGAGATDPRNWIAPDVLATMTSRDPGATSLGMLVNSEGIHRGPFRYLIAARRYPVELMPLTEKGNTWGDVFANEWILVKDGFNGDVESGGQMAIERILSGDGYFRLLYEKITTYPLPGNEHATLYHRAVGPAFPRADATWRSTTQPLAAAINAGWSEGAQLLLPDADVATWLATETVTATQVSWIEGTPPDPAASPLFVVVTPAQDPRPLFDHAFYPAGTLDGERATLVVYGQPHQPLRPIPVNAAWNAFQLSGLNSWTDVRGGEVLPLELSVSGELPPGHKISFRLTDAGGQVIRQVDRPLSETVRAGIQVLPEIPPARYSVMVVVYDATTLAPLPSMEGTNEVRLFDVVIR